MLYREPIHFNLQSKDGFDASGPCLTVKKGFTRLMLGTIAVLAQSGCFVCGSDQNLKLFRTAPLFILLCAADIDRVCVVLPLAPNSLLPESQLARGQFIWKT